MEYAVGGWQGMAGSMGWGWFFLALLIVGVVVLVLALVRGSSGGRDAQRPTGRSRAREVLDEGYARGEIDTTEYEDRVQRLGESQ